ncbi:DUF4179 domain-containing protein [Clostridiaceae bacterium 35-E11]
MICKEIQKHLLEYVEQSMDEGKRKEIAVHIKACEECKKELKELKEAIHFIEDHKNQVSIPYGFMERLRNQQKDIQRKINKPKKRLMSGFLVAAILTLFVVTAFGLEGFNVIEWWKNQSLKESESIEELIDKGYGDRLNLTAEDQGVKITIESVIADDINTVLLMEIVDMKGNIKYEPSYEKDGIMAKGNFFYDKDAVGSVYERNGESPTGGSFIFYTPEENRTRIITTLNPVGSSQETIDFIIKELRKLGPDKDQILKGNWRFQIPVKKYDAYTYGVNQEIDLDGTPVTVEKIVIAPTATVLTYSYKNRQDKINYMHNLRIEANGVEYRQRPYGTEFYYSDNKGFERQTFEFDSMYFDLPKEIKIKIDGYHVTVEKYKKLDIKWDKSFPQTFMYMGSPITIESVVLGHQQARIRMVDHLENRTYEGLDFDVKVKGNSFTTHTYKSDGEWLDEKGKKVKKEESSHLRDKKEKLKFHTTAYDILVENAPFTDEYISKEQRGTKGIVPWRIQIKGYEETRFVDKAIIVKLLE